MIAITLCGLMLAQARAGVAHQAERPVPVSWRLEITTSGGITGRGSGSVFISSSGLVRCSRPRSRCPDSLDPAHLSELDREIRSAPLSGWSELERGVCSDCVVTVVRISREMTDGAVQTSTASWDPTSRTRAPRDAIRIHDLAWASLRA